MAALESVPTTETMTKNPAIVTRNDHDSGVLQNVVTSSTGVAIAMDSDLSVSTKRSAEDDDSEGYSTMDAARSSKRIMYCTVLPFRRIPCKARGLSNKHNRDTAYIEIPNDAPHGLPLMCSHPECAGTGRRFRYCKVCRLPVAKRNFLKRHGHGLINTTQELKEKVDNICNEYVSVPMQDSEAGVAKEKELDVPEQASTTIFHPRHRRVVSFDSGNTNSFLPLGFSFDENVEGNEAIPKETAATPKAYSDIPTSFLDLSDYERKWMALLRDRPPLEYEVDMTAWIQRVISFSDTAQAETQQFHVRSGSPPDAAAKTDSFSAPLQVAPAPSEHSASPPLQAITNELTRDAPPMENISLSAHGPQLVDFSQGEAQLPEMQLAEAIGGVDFSTVFD